ncbi:MAG: hypothetical protein HFJ35_04595 [Clostridia bacterium]|nr:hypothetical protein [Clostridia bacterium]
MGYDYTTRLDPMGENVILRRTANDFFIEPCWHLVARVRPRTGLSFYRITDSDEKTEIEDIARIANLL